MSHKKLFLIVEAVLIVLWFSSSVIQKIIDWIPWGRCSYSYPPPCTGDVCPYIDIDIGLCLRDQLGTYISLAASYLAILLLLVFVGIVLFRFVKRRVVHNEP